jgi:hypothetical protein
MDGEWLGQTQKCSNRLNNSRSPVHVVNVRDADIATESLQYSVRQAHTSWRPPKPDLW